MEMPNREQFSAAEKSQTVITNLLEKVREAEESGHDPDLLMGISHSLSASRHLGSENYEAVTQTAAGANLSMIEAEMAAAIDTGRLEEVNDFLNALYNEAAIIKDDPEHQMSAESREDIGTKYAVMARSYDEQMPKAA